MDIVIAGGHGQIALLLTRELAARGDRVRGLIRNPDHEQDLRAAGAEPVLCDLEHAAAGEVARAVGSADALVFAAGAGAGSGAERKRTMDLGGAVTTLAAARENGIGRYVIVSAMGAAEPPEGEEGMAPYLRAKAEADAAVAASGLAYVIVRPGGLTNDPPTGRVRIAERTGRGNIPRADVAAVLAAVLADPGITGATFELIGGEDPVADAVRTI